MIELKHYNNDDFDRGASAFVELLWLITRVFIFLIPIPMGSKARVFFLRRFGASIGKNVVIRSGVKVNFPWRLTIGNDLWIGDEVNILALAPVRIDNDVCLSQKAFLCTGSHNFHIPTFDLITKPIVIESNCWIAAGAFIGPGVTVGSGSVCSAGAVVLSNVPARSKALGNPCQVTPLKSNHIEMGK